MAGAEGWAYYGGDEGGSRYSALKQINRDNVGKLALAWQYRTGAMVWHFQTRHHDVWDRDAG